MEEVGNLVDCDIEVQTSRSLLSDLDTSIHNRDTIETMYLYCCWEL